MSQLAAASGPHLFWIASRAAGVLALLLSSTAVGAGLLMSGRMIRVKGLELRGIHEALSLATMIALVVHAGSLLGDSYMSPSLIDVTVPFASDFSRWWLSTGIIAGWGLILLGLSYYARSRIGVARWRKLHRLTAVAWLAALAHSAGMGTDAGRVWFVVSVALVAVPAALLLATRVPQLLPAPSTQGDTTP